MSRFADVPTEFARLRKRALHLGRGVTLCRHQACAEFDLQRKFSPWPFLAVRGRPQQLQCFAEMGDGLDVRRPGAGPEPRLLPILDRFIRLTCERQVVCDQLGIFGHDVGTVVDIGAGDPPVKLLPSTDQERLICRVLDERMSERVLRVWRNPRLGQYLASHELLELRPQIGLAHGRNGSQQPVRKCLAENGAELGDDLRSLQPVEASHQRVAKRCRNGVRRSRAGNLQPVAAAAKETGLQQRLGQLFHEQRNAAGLFDDVFEHRGRQRPAVRDAVYHSGDIASPKPIYLQGNHVGVDLPLRREVGAKRQEHHGLVGFDALDKQTDQVAGRCIGPMDIFDHEDQRLAQTLAKNPGCDDIQSPSPLCLRRKLERQKPFRQGNREKLGKQGHGVGMRPRKRQKRHLQPVHPLLQRVVRIDTKQSLHLRNDRVQRAIAEIGRAGENHPAAHFAQ